MGSMYSGSGVGDGVGVAVGDGVGVGVGVDVGDATGALSVVAADVVGTSVAEDDPAVIVGCGGSYAFCARKEAA